MRKAIFRFGFVTFIILILTIYIPASESPLSQKPWEVDDVILQENASGLAISPDGQWLIWVKSIPHQKKDGRVSHLFLTRLAEKPTTIQLTLGDDSEFNPRWSPSGEKVAFLSSRKIPEAKDISGSQLWLFKFPGGEPEPITQLPFGVRDFEWLDENRLLLIAREKRTLREEEKKKRKDTAYVVEDQEHMIPYRLFILNLETKQLERLTTNQDQITSMALSFDKKWVITRHNQSVRYQVDKKVKPKFFLLNLETRKMEEIFPDPKFKPNMFAWDLNNQGFYFSVTRTSDYINEGPGADFLYYFDLKTRKYREINLEWKWGLFYLGFQVRPDGFVASLANGARPKWRRYYRQGQNFSYEEIKGQHAANVYRLVLHQTKDIGVYQFTTASTPPQWYWARLEKNRLQPLGQVIKLNSHLKNKNMARTEVIRWVGALDEEIEGLLYYPHDYQPGRRYPLILMIHGGPTGVDMDAFRESWAAYPNLMAQRGAFVLRPNYHGSGGYGQKFAESIKGHYYEYELPDMLKGIDYLVKKGLVDPNQVAAMGWSNGGILTVALSVWTNRIKTAGVGAADVNWISDYGNCAFGVSFDNYYFKGPFWENLDHYLEKSPLFHLQHMQVPTIIFHGTEDTNVPYGQGWEYYRALQQIGLAPVRFIVFPGEPHGLRKLSHQRRKMTEELAWFDRYFFKKSKPQNESLKKNSPLDIALKKLAFARVNGAFGRLVKKKLIPETVRVEVKGQRVEIGRFEVTRAQWAAFKPSYHFSPETANLPVSGLSFEEAQKYVQWLSQLTGEKYRLPRVAELESLSKKAKTGNTLDYWAGYTLNYDDAQQLQQFLKKKGQLTLLLPVDYFAPSGPELIFGLGGNVAEWAVNEQGQGQIVGRCAWTPEDQKTKYTPPLTYVGLRVLKEIPKEK